MLLSQLAVYKILFIGINIAEEIGSANLKILKQLPFFSLHYLIVQSLEVEIIISLSVQMRLLILFVCPINGRTKLPSILNKQINPSSYPAKILKDLKANEHTF